MKKNMGTIDRVLRILAAAVIGALYVMGTIGGVAAIVLGIVAAMFVVTGFIGYCPGYVPLGISTRKAAADSVRV
jgi:amino acid transporter